jgi:hypothetical protein
VEGIRRRVHARCERHLLPLGGTGLGNIKHPEADVQFNVVVGISSSYQFFMLREGEVLARSHSAYTFFDVATARPGQGARLAPFAA